MKNLWIWLGMWLPVDLLRHGVEILGGPGTGKTLILKAFRLALARLMRRHRNLRIKVIDLDFKGDLYGIFSAFPDDCPVFDLDPFIDGDVYDVMAEMVDPRDVAELAALFIDVSANETQKFFPQSARSIARKLWTRHWLEVPDDTTFADLVNTCTTPQAMRRVAASHPTTRGLLPLLNENEVGLSIMSTLAMEMEKFEIPAALYQSNTTGRRVSSNTLVTAPRCYVRLPMNARSRETLAPIGRLFLTSAMNRVLPLVEKDMIVPVLMDEMSMYPGGFDLSAGAIFGRESGWCPIYSLQSYLSAFKTFGKEKLEATISTCKTFICFNVKDPQDAEIAAKKFGSFDGTVRQHGGGSSHTVGFPGQSSYSVNWSDSPQEVKNVTSGMIQSLAIPTRNSKFIEFYMVTAGSPPALHRIEIARLVDAFFEDVKPVAPPPPRAPHDMVLDPWDDDDLERLNLDDPDEESAE